MNNNLQLHPLMTQIQVNKDVRDIRLHLGLTLDEFCWELKIKKYTIYNMEKTMRFDYPVKLSLDQFINFNDFLLRNEDKLKDFKLESQQ